MRLDRKARIRRLKPFLTIGFMALVGFLVFKTLRNVDYGDVQRSLSMVSYPKLGKNLLLVCGVYWILASYDYLSLRILNSKKLDYPRALWSAFVCYGFTLNVGALVGGLGFRYRIYSKWKLSADEVSRVILYSTATNWLGYCALMGGCFLLQEEEIERLTQLSPLVSRLVGGLLTSAVLAYFYFCQKQKVLRFRSKEFRFPKVRIAAIQITASTVQWLLLGYTLWYSFTSLGLEVPYGEVFFVLLVASIAGVVTHIPAGMGVLEAIFLNMELGVTPAQLLGGLVVFRIVFYLIPLVFTLGAYLALELYFRKRDRRP